MRTGSHANRRVVLRRDTAIELGGAGAGSYAFTLVTSDVSLVRDGRIALLGPDMDDLPADEPVLFAQVILVAGRDLDDEDVRLAESCQQTKDYIEGYQVRSMPGQVWSRVSRDLMDRGFCFGALGAALARLVRETVPEAQKVEVLFAAGRNGEASCFEGPCRDALGRSRAVRKDVWMRKGVDIDCPLGGHCGSCGLKSTCTEVRRMKAMKDRRETGEGVKGHV